MPSTRLRSGRVRQQCKETEQIEHIRKLEGKMVQRTGGLHSRFNAIEAQIKTQDNREIIMASWISSLMSKVDRIPCGPNNTAEAQDMISNGLLSRGWEIIRPVPARRGENSGKLPRNFPETVRRFWELRAKEHSMYIPYRRYPAAAHRPTFRIGKHLVSLLVFYRTQGHDDWILDLGAYDSDSDSRSNSRSNTDSDSDSDIEDRIRNNIKRELRLLVRWHPKKAHRTLAVELGLDYDRIEACLHKDRKKRHRDEDRDRRERKRQRHE
ncbi:MAG: hypothetical protein Q9228_004324 [Teloschistes exilis]